MIFALASIPLFLCIQCKQKGGENVLKQVNDCPQTSREKPRFSKGVYATLLMLLALSGFYAVGAEGMTVAANKRELPIYCVDRSDNKISISFDAAWGGDQTEEILNILDAYGVKTTFFLVDIWSERFPELVTEIDARGHEIGNHSTSHPQMSRLSAQKIREELTKMDDRLESLIGKRSALFRPPYGDYNNLVVRTARDAGYEVIQWSVDSLDWKNKGTEDLIRRATSNVKSGDILLFHNDSKYILQALPKVLESLQQQGFEIVPISQLLLDGNTVIDTQGRQKAAPETVPEVEKP